VPHTADPGTVRAIARKRPGIRERIQDYLDAGSKAVWAFYPKLRVIAVYDKSGVKELRGDQILEAPEILPRFQAQAGPFFD
jgi:Uma2 family endonuclease